LASITIHALAATTFLSTFNSLGTGCHGQSWCYELAFCLVFVSSTQWSWGDMAFNMVANVIAIGVAVLINNLSEKQTNLTQIF
jgi:hypothetical protein